MDIQQFATLIVTILAPTLGSVYLFYNIVHDRMNRLEENMKRTEERHREDLKAIEEKWDRMDAKWERLFERLLIQDGKRTL